MSDFLNDDCSICLESLVSRRNIISNKENPTLFSTPCEHYFHRECLLDWFNNGHPGNCCPMCKREMRWSEAIPVLGIFETRSTTTELAAGVRQACSNASSQSTLNTSPRTVPQCQGQNARSVGSTAAAAAGVWDFREMYHESINARGVRVEGASRETANGNDWRNAPLRMRDLQNYAGQNVEQVQRDATFAQWIAEMEAEEIRRDALRNAEQTLRDAQYARTVAEQTRRDAQHAQRVANQERRDAEHARRLAEQGARRAQRDAENVRRAAELDAERARRDYSRMTRRIAEMQADFIRRDAERNAKQVQRDVEYTKRIAEQAQRDAENAQMTAEVGAEMARMAAEQAQGNVDYSRMEPPNGRGDSPYRRRDIDYFRGESPYRRRDTRRQSPYRRRDIH